MRQQSRIKVTVHDAVIGGPKPLLCLPLVAADIDELLDQVDSQVVLDPDLFEWRVDGYKNITDIAGIIDSCKKLREAVEQTPVILTCRSHLEGGLTKLSQEVRLELFLSVIESKLIDIIDVEICNEHDFIKEIEVKAKENNIKLILSYHNFTKTPGESFLIETLQRGQELGADIVKIAVMPNSMNDVLTLFYATNTARNNLIDIPMVTISMGKLGEISRIAGGLFGSDITFATGKKSSAPGQFQFRI